MGMCDTPNKFVVDNKYIRCIDSHKRGVLSRMNYSPASVMKIVGITQETLRHWRKVLFPLAKRKGRQGFSVGDMLVLLIIKELTTTFKLQVNGLASVIPTLSDICNVIKWDSYHDKFLGINIKQQEVEVLSKSITISELSTPLILIDVNQHIMTLSRKLLESDSVEQLELYFPPRLVSSTGF